MANPFDMFKAEETTHTIKALNGAKITLKNLSLQESTRVDTIMYTKGFKDDGTPILSMEDITAAKLLRLSLALVEPTMSVKDLESLSIQSMEAINEITDIINPPRVDEGNES